MSLRRVYDERVFDDATTDERRTRVYVVSGELGLAGDDRPESQLMRSLASDEPPQRLHIVGPSGAGKTSLILRVVTDLAKRELEPRAEVLILRVGDRPDNLASPEAVMKMVLDTIAVHGHRFSNVPEEVFQAASADERTHNPLQVEHEAGLTAPVVSYSVTLKEAYRTLEFGQNAARVRHDLEDVIRTVSDAGYRPVLVIDDTEKFVSPGPHGEIEAGSIDNLYHHGVRVLGELPIDLVVAMHPRFEEVPRVREVIERLAMSRLDVPELPAETEEPALRKILVRRMERDSVEGQLESVIDPEAVEDLQVLYHERDRDLRSVLRLAHRAAGHALNRSAAVISARDIREVVRDERSGS